MFVGEAVSELVDKEKASRMNFELEGNEAVEAGLWEKLVQIEDTPGSIKDLATERSKPKQQTVNIIKPKKIIPATKEKAAKPMIVEVLDDDDEEEEDDLVPYAKPDSDTEDSDEDATLVERNKPKAPVYVQLKSRLTNSQHPD